MESLTRKLQALRVERGWDKLHTANQLKITTSAYTKIESGMIEPDLPRLQAFARLYDISLTELLTFEADNQNSACNDERILLLNRTILSQEGEIIALKMKVIELYEKLQVK